MGTDPETLIQEAEQEKQNRGELAQEALHWFLRDENLGEMHPRSDVVAELVEELGISTRRADLSISDTVGDIVDPVQQITKGPDRFVGIVEYKVFSEAGAYGYIDYDDTLGPRKRVVCAKCVEEATHDSEVSHATEGEGSSGGEESWSSLLDKVTAHYTQAHSEAPSEIEPGASLVNGTTIASNTAFHAGNEGNIDHNNLSNRTHDGDDLTPNSVDASTINADGPVTANGTSYIGTFDTENDLPDPSNFDEGDEATVISDPNGQTSKYTLVDE